MQTYTGVRELIIKDEDLQSFYEDGREYNLLTNEYVKVRNEQGEVIYLGKWNGENFVPLKYKKIDSDYFGIISPLNDEQRFWFDCLQNDNILIKFCLSKFGTGKTMASLCWALTEINSKKSKYKCLHYVRNNLECKDVVGIGSLPGDLNLKLRPWALEISDVLAVKICSIYMSNKGKLSWKVLDIAEAEVGKTALFFWMNHKILAVIYYRFC